MNVKENEIQSKDNSLNHLQENGNFSIKEYEKIIQKLEEESRDHIRLEQQLKLYIDNIQDQIEESFFEIKSLKKNLMEATREIETLKKKIKDQSKKYDEIKLKYEEIKSVHNKNLNIDINIHNEHNIKEKPEISKLIITEREKSKNSEIESNRRSSIKSLLKIINHGNTDRVYHTNPKKSFNQNPLSNMKLIHRY